jgi:hypothetical protein
MDELNGKAVKNRFSKPAGPMGRGVVWCGDGLRLWQLFKSDFPKGVIRGPNSPPNVPRFRNIKNMPKFGRIIR